MFDVIVIGGGPAGVTATLRARELGAAVALVEQGKMGGTCTNDGCVPTRVLAKAARLVRETRQFESYGLVRTSPELDFGRLMERTQTIVYTIHQKKQLIYHLESSGATVFAQAGTAHFIDPHTIGLPDGRKLEAHKFILCSGGHARRLDFPGAELALSHQDIWSLRKLPRSIVIVGGAATGCQLATILAEFGARVTLLEKAPRILRVEDEMISQIVQEAFQEHGIQVIPQIDDVHNIEKLERGVAINFSAGSERQHIETDAVILSSGWLGNVSALNLEAAGVEHERSYVRVNDYLQTSAEHIFAAGDITGRMMLVQSAGYEARVAAENAVLGLGQHQKHELVPHGGFTDPEYGGIGMTEAQARAAEDCAVAVVPYSDLDRAVIDGHTRGACKMIVSRETHRILGAHIVGEQALEIVHVVAAGMAADMWVEQLAELEIAYPTFTAVVGLAARKIIRELGVMPLTTQWRSLGIPHAEWERSSE